MPTTVQGFAKLGVAVVVHLLLQFLFQWVLLTQCGAGRETDLFFGTFAIPQFVLLVLSSSLTMVLIPYFSALSLEQRRAETWSYLQWMGLAFGGLALLMTLTSSLWLSWLLPGFSGTDQSAAQQLLAIQLGTMVFSAVLAVQWAFHSAEGNFVRIETTGILAHGLALLAMWFLLPDGGVVVAAWISLARAILQNLLLLPGIGPYQSAQSSPALKANWRKWRPLIAGNLYVKTDTLVDRALSSTALTGDLTLLNLAQQLYNMGNTVLSKVLVNTLLPKLSQLSAESQQPAFRHVFIRRWWVLMLASVGVYLGLLMLGKPMLEWFFAVKSMRSEDIARLWWLLVLLGGLWIGGLLGSLTSSAFYAVGDTQTPTWMTVVLYTLYVPLKFWAFYRWGMEGLAISISGYYLLSVGIQLFLLYRKGLTPAWMIRR